MDELKDVKEAISSLLTGKTAREQYAIMNEVYDLVDETREAARHAMCTEMARENVRRGAAFLTERFPDWREKLNVPGIELYLDMASGTGCVLARASGLEFSQALYNLLDRDVSWAIDHGFLGTEVGVGDRQLRDAWLALLAETPAE